MPASRYIFASLPWYSVLIVAGICAAIWLAGREEKRLGLPKDTVIDLALMVIPLGIVGARLYYVAFAWDVFRDDPISILYVWNGGLAIFGGIIGGVLAAVLFARWRRIPELTLLDMIVPGVALAQAIGRWGNFFNMEAYGVPVTDPAWQFFPAAVLIPAGGQAVWHMATFFYESVWDLGVFAALWLMRRRTRRRGDLLVWYALLYSAGRHVIEGLRMDSLYTPGGAWRVSQLLSMALCLTAVGIFAWRGLRHAGRRSLVAAGTAGAAAVALCIVLPAPDQAFPMEYALWAALCAISTAGALTSASVRGAAVPLAVVLASLALRAGIALADMRGLPADTLVCALYSAAAILVCACLYHTSK